MPNAPATGAQVEEAANFAVSLSAESLTPEERDHLSKALFPDTHTNRVTILEQERTLRPVPVKVSRKLYSLLKDYAEKVQEEGAVIEEPTNAEEAVAKYEEEILKRLFEITKSLAEFYGWSDVIEAVAQEGLSVPEMEGLAYTQQELNSANDFLLQPLRVFVRMLQVREIVLLKLEKSVTTSTLPLSVEPGIVPSTT